MQKISFLSNEIHEQEDTKQANIIDRFDKIYQRFSFLIHNQQKIQILQIQQLHQNACTIMDEMHKISSKNQNKNLGLYLLTSIKIFTKGFLAQQLQQSDYDEITEIFLSTHEDPKQNQFIIQSKDLILLMCVLTQNQKSFEKTLSFFQDFYNQIQIQNSSSSYQQSFHSPTLIFCSFIDIISIFIEIKILDYSEINAQLLARLSEEFNKLIQRQNLNQSQKTSLMIKIMHQACLFYDNDNLKQLFIQVTIFKLVQNFKELSLINQSKFFSEYNQRADSIFYQCQSSELKQFSCTIKLVNNVQKMLLNKGDNKLIIFLAKIIRPHLTIINKLSLIIQFIIDQSSFQFMSKNLGMKRDSFNRIFLQILVNYLQTGGYLSQAVVAFSFIQNLKLSQLQIKVKEYGIKTFNSAIIQFIPSYPAFCMLRNYFLQEFSKKDQHFNKDAFFYLQDEDEVEAMKQERLKEFLYEILDHSL